MMESSENLPGQVVDVERDTAPTPVDVDTTVLLLGAGVTAITHPLLYVKLLIQVLMELANSIRDRQRWSFVSPG